jgi:NAD(P)-dependent dehydrogenase (short-subunit alcohol dehydrogenase family)
MNLSRLFSLENQVVVITGGYGYLGKSMVEGLLDAGATVVVAGKSEEKFHDAFPLVIEKLHFIQTNITLTEDLKNLFQTVWEKFNRIDVLINNAFVCVVDGEPDQLSDFSFSETLHGTLQSVYSAIREVLPYFKKRKSGRIINIGSMYGIVSPDFSVYDNNPEMMNPPNYGAAKAGVIQITKYFAEYLGKEGILVNTISPGPFPSNEVQKEEIFIKKISEKTSLKRIGKPEEIQGAVVFLCSPSASYITGHNLVIDGGWTIK